MKSWSLLTSQDFLEFKKCPNQGSYGSTYFCKLPPSFGKLSVVVKMNRSRDTDLQHEYHVAQRLEKAQIKGFSKALHFFKENDKQFLILEKICSQQSLLEAMLVMTPEQILSVVRQIIVNLWEAQKKVQFVHNDLHLNNVLITKTSMKYFNFYHLKFPTCGVAPVIIDFGFSHFDNWKLYPIMTQCTQTHHGMNPFVFNEKFDFLTLLHSVRKDCGFDKALKNTITKMIAEIGEDYFYKNFKWRKMRYSLFDLMIVMCEFPSILDVDQIDNFEDDEKDNWKTIKKMSEKQRQEHLLSDIIKCINPNNEGRIVDFAREWNFYRLSEIPSPTLLCGLEFIFSQFLKKTDLHRKPFSQKNIEKLLSG